MDWKGYFDRELGVFDYDRWYADGGTEADLPDTIRDNEDNPQRNRGNINVSGDIDGGSGGGITDFREFLDAQLEPWVDETDPIREHFREWLKLEGVAPGKEGEIASFAQAASTRAADAAGSSGMFFSGIHEGEQQGIWQATMRDALESRRARTETAGGILSGLSGQLADLLGRGISEGGEIYGPGNQRAPFQGMWGRTESGIARQEAGEEAGVGIQEEQLDRLRRMREEDEERRRQQQAA